VIAEKQSGTAGHQQRNSTTTGGMSIVNVTGMSTVTGGKIGGTVGEIAADLTPGTVIDPGTSPESGTEIARSPGDTGCRCC